MGHSNPRQSPFANSLLGYLGACHAGAAIEGLCYTGGTLDSLGQYEHYSLNATYENATQGLLVWELPLSGENDTTTYIPSALTLGPNYGSNVAVPLFIPGTESNAGLLYVNVYPNGTLYLQGGVNDTANTATQPIPATYFGDLTNWVLCNQMTGGYYYYSIGWVSGVGPAQNPTCQPVDLTFQDVPANDTVLATY